MKIIGAYLLAVLGGNNNPDSYAINKILNSVGLEADEDSINKIISDMEGKEISELMCKGSNRLSYISIPKAPPSSA